MNFNDALIHELRSSAGNNFTDNIDHIRYPGLSAPSKLSKAGLSSFLRSRFPKTFESLRPMKVNEKEGLAFLYSKLADDASKELLVKLIAFRKLGAQKVRLPLSTAAYWKKYQEIDAKANQKDLVQASLSTRLPRQRIEMPGIEMYMPSMAIMTTFEVEQYAYRKNGKEVCVRSGNTVIDAGGCWGDTALYFASKVGDGGKVYTFEFIPSNIGIFRKNLRLNPSIENRIVLVESPVWERSGLEMHYVDYGPGSRVSFEKSSDSSGKVTTESIDGLVEKRGIGKVDFIKMDIEGAEPNALAGAVNTLRRDRPVLAIAIYHNMEEFVGVPAWIDALDLGYKFYLGHATIHSEETVLFATI